MKKEKKQFRIYLGLMLCFMAIFWSCSKDDGIHQEVEVVEDKQLNLFSSLSEVEENEEVTFKVYLEDAAIEAAIYIDDQPITGSSYLFEKEGNYKVVAKKEGYLDSEELWIKVSTSLTDLYIVGNQYVDGKNRAVYWKNKKLHVLTDGTRHAFATDIFVNQGNVYIAGYEMDSYNPNDNPTALYWKNGVRYELTDGSQYNIASGIFVDGEDVYVAGTSYDGVEVTTKYWKNGTEISLNTSGNYGGAVSITVEQGDVYVAGATQKNDNGPETAKYWKNGVAVHLSDGKKSANARAMFLDAGSVYVAGHFDGKAVYWKDHILHYLDGGESSSYANAVVIDNGIAHLVGQVSNGRHYVATYWKNGVKEFLPLGEGKQESRANDIVLHQDTTHIIGYENDGKGSNYVAKYWKNNQAFNLSSGEYSTYANALFVVEKQ
ncbi:hypothetical protein [Myroides fluvii]|uniref:hypothetical protein n=1 Tax=Myroides fluvii TaxID=2572594 RepID=UPI00131B3586|nr:hypothetical protein [Myroides fluvii]